MTILQQQTSVNINIIKGWSKKLGTAGSNQFPKLRDRTLPYIKTYTTLPKNLLTLRSFRIFSCPIKITSFLPQGNNWTIYQYHVEIQSCKWGKIREHNSCSETNTICMQCKNCKHIFQQLCLKHFTNLTNAFVHIWTKLTDLSPYLNITPLIIWKLLNQGEDSGVHMKSGGTRLLYFSALLWVDREKTPLQKLQGWCQVWWVMDVEAIIAGKHQAKGRCEGRDVVMYNALIHT